jgi:hypothetical protein
MVYDIMEIETKHVRIVKQTHTLRLNERLVQQQVTLLPHHTQRKTPQFQHHVRTRTTITVKIIDTGTIQTAANQAKKDLSTTIPQIETVAKLLSITI